MGRVRGDPPKTSFLALRAKMGSSLVVQGHQSKRPGICPVFYFGAPMRPVVETDCPELAIDSVEANRFGLLV